MLAEQPLAIRVDLMGHAAALGHPITWPEPFGLVIAEALATATPALAFPTARHRRSSTTATPGTLAAMRTR
jgi:glycosyltransferase involved in cell wall biosynthesis